MEIIRGDGTLLNEIDLAPANAHQEVLQNVAVLLDLIQQSCPMFREGGLPGSMIHRPLPVVKSLIVGYIYDQVGRYEPRAIIKQVTFDEEATTGRLIPIVELEGVNEDE